MFWLAVSVCFVFFLAKIHVRSYCLTRDGTSAPCTQRWGLDHWTTREAPEPNYCQTNAYLLKGGMTDGCMDLDL